MRALSSVVAGLLAAGVLAGCGSGDERPATSVEVADTINYGSFGTKADINCGEGKSLNVGGSNNTLRVIGRCGSISVGGADNRLTVDRIDGRLSVVGLNNSITYRAGEPQVDDTGTGNRITRD